MRPQDLQVFPDPISQLVVLQFVASFGFHNRSLLTRMGSGVFGGGQASNLEKVIPPKTPDPFSVLFWTVIELPAQMYGWHKHRVKAGIHSPRAGIQSTGIKNPRCSSLCRQCSCSH